MVATTQVRFLVGANYGVDFKKKIVPPVKSGFKGFLSWEKVSSS
jgi:hypothetical protein